MAVGIQNYPNITPADSDYPNGSIRDKNGTVHGTPLNKLVYNDIHTLLDKLLREAEIEANGLPDGEYVGNQYYQALLMNCFNRVGAPIITGLIGSYTEDDLIVLYGVTISVVSNTATWTKGCIYYNGNIYFVPAGSDTKSPGDTFFYTITNDMMFEIGISHGSSGAGIADYGANSIKKIINSTFSGFSIDSTSNLTSPAINVVHARKEFGQVTYSIVVSGTTISNTNFNWIINCPDGFKMKTSSQAGGTNISTGLLIRADGKATIADSSTDINCYIDSSNRLVVGDSTGDIGATTPISFTLNITGDIE